MWATFPLLGHRAWHPQAETAQSKPMTARNKLYVNHDIDRSVAAATWRR